MYYIEQLLLIAVFFHANEVAAFKFRIMIENAWQTGGVPNGAEIDSLDTRESKHGAISFSKEAVKLCSATLARQLLTEANNTEIISKTPKEMLYFSPILCDDACPKQGLEGV
jgi:hypothetical protein